MFKWLLCGMSVFSLSSFVPLLRAQPKQQLEQNQVLLKSSFFLQSCYQADKDPYLDRSQTALRMKKEVGETDCLEAYKKLQKSKILVMRFANLIDLSPLREFSKLEVLSLGGNKIRSLKDLSGLVELRELNLGGFRGFNEVSDLSPL